MSSNVRASRRSVRVRMRGSTGGSPTSATLRIGLPCHPLRAAGAEAVIEVADVRRVDGEYVALVWIADDDASAVAVGRRR